MVGVGDQPSGVEPGTVSVGLLGPLSIVVNGVDRSVTAPRQRAVCAFLAVHAGEGVSADRLLDAVWGEDLPAAATWAVHPLGMKSGMELLIDRACLARSGFVVDERQRSLAVVMDWSYELLDESERRLLRRLSLCVGGFTLDAALQVGVPEGDDTTVADVLDRLGRLVEASLIEFDDSDDRPRYRMLETVREYASGQLDALNPGERVAIEVSHAHHYASIATDMSDLLLQDHARLRCPRTMSHRPSGYWAVRDNPARERGEVAWPHRVR